MRALRGAAAFAALLLPTVAAAQDAPAAPSGSAAPAAGDDRAAAEPSPRAPRPAPRTEEVTVVAPPILEENRVAKDGTQIGVVSARQIEALNAGDLTSALRRVPGIVVARYDVVGGYGGADGGAVYIRGQGTGRPGAEIATLTDGVPRFAGVWTHPLIDDLSIDGADRIEIYRSPQPVRFGDGAFGAINIVSRRREEEGEATRLSLSAGGYGLRTARLATEGREGEFDWTARVGYRAADGHRPDADGRTADAAAQLGWRIGGGWDATLRVERTQGAESDPGAEGAPKPPAAPRFATNDTFALVTLSRVADSAAYEAKIYRDKGHIDWLQWDQAKGEFYTTLTDWNNYGARLAATFAPWRGGEIELGADDDRWGGESVEKRPTIDKPVDPPRFENRAAHARLSHRFAGATPVTVSAGARFTDSKFFGGEWGGEVGVVVDASFAQLRAVAARGANFPGVWAAALYAGFPNSAGWKDLRPEKTRHVEIGAAREFGRRLRLDVALFRNRLTDGLRFVAPPPRFENIREETIDGVEATASVAAARGLELFVGATVTGHDPSNAPDAPRRTASFGLAWDLGRGFALDADAQYVDGHYAFNPRFPGAASLVGAAAPVNARLSKKAAFAGRPLTLFLAAENLFDRDDEYLPGYPAPGRFATFGATWEF